MKPKSRKALIPLLLSVLIIVLFLAIPVRTIFNDPTSTVVLDRNGELLRAKIAADGQWRFPHNENVPEKFAKALIAFEDKRFYYHPGVDVFAISRALYSNLSSGRKISGASTITMQVVRLSRKNKPRTISEKIIEAFIALRIELRYSKSEILAIYASNAPFGGNVVGLDAAAWRYFGCKADNLSWAEAATLAVLPNTPALIHPGRNRPVLFQKRNLLLEKLLKRKIISQEDYELALIEPLPDKPVSLPAEAMHLLERMNVAWKGKLINSTVDFYLQKNATRIVNSHAAYYRSNQIHNAAALIIDNNSGQVLAYVGNVSDTKATVPGAMVDLITAQRSGGSILKPFLFAAMLHEGLITHKTLLPDYPFQIPGFNPQNFDRKFDGAVPASSALQRSLNVPAVRMLQQYGVEKFYYLLQKLGMSTLKHPPAHYGLSLILGGAESTLWDVTTMYARLSKVLQNYTLNDGMYDKSDMFDPVFLLPSDNGLDKIRKNNRSELEPTGILDASAIWLTFNALFEVNRPEEEAGWKMFSNSRRVAWKTGTSYGNRDAWAVGTTPEYTVGVWVGNASGEGRPDLTGVGYAAPILFDLFGILPPTTMFRQPYDDMVLEKLCTESGYIANDNCTETDSVWISLKSQRTTSCPYHIPVHLDVSGKYRVNSDCYQVHKIQKVSWFVLPPAMEWFYRMHHPGYQDLPPWHPDCKSTQENNPMQLIYPSGNIQAMIPRELGGKMGKIVLQAVHSDKDAVIYWHLDGEYLGFTKNEHNFAISSGTGLKHLVIVDENGNRLEQKFRIVAPK
ncbi:MAG: penicillin-binding protein 1C [Bacteroidales bacterium]